MCETDFGVYRECLGESVAARSLENSVMGRGYKPLCRRLRPVVIGLIFFCIYFLLLN